MDECDMGFAQLKKLWLIAFCSGFFLSTLIFDVAQGNAESAIPPYYSKINSIPSKTFSLLSQYQIKIMHSREEFGNELDYGDIFSVVKFLGKNKKFNISGSICRFSNGQVFPYNPDIEIPVIVSAGYAF